MGAKPTTQEVNQPVCVRGATLQAVTESKINRPSHKDKAAHLREALTLGLCHAASGLINMLFTIASIGQPSAQNRLRICSRVTDLPASDAVEHQHSCMITLSQEQEHQYSCMITPSKAPNISSHI